MRLPTTLFLLFVLAISCSGANSLNNNEKVIYTEYDSLKVVQIIDQFNIDTQLPANDLFLNIARSFIGTPYKGQTLELNEAELLIVNLREFDCTTYIENCMALTSTVLSEKPSFDIFIETLRNIRYRKGQINGYTNRLHYFTDWITDNEEKGYIVDKSELFGGIPYPNQVNFMSTHISAYRQLAADSNLIPLITHIEKEISGRTYLYLPKTNIDITDLGSANGMIVAFTTQIKGLDVVHTGIIIIENEEVKLLHASSDEGKVVITDKNLQEYINSNKSQSGIILVQPIFKQSDKAR